MDELLTQEEADALPDGTEVIITWSGGNGPHRYVIHVVGRMRFAGDPRNDNPLTFVGTERFHTHVQLADPEEPHG
jgi:hypothetical protein